MDFAGAYVIGGNVLTKPHSKELRQENGNRIVVSLGKDVQMYIDQQYAAYRVNLTPEEANLLGRNLIEHSEATEGWKTG